MFPDNLEEGMRASVVCSVVSGDPPIRIKWFKDGRDIESVRRDPPSPDSMLKVVSITEFVSSLIIDRLDRSFSGNYTCKATSDFAGSTNHTARLSVRSKPVWVLKPTSQTVIAGSSGRFDCVAHGFPEPVIRWKRMRPSSRFGSPFFHSPHDDNLSSSPSDQRNVVTILSSPRIHVLENGSLVIKSVEVEDQGKYYCEASNGVAKSEETSAELLVYEAPTVRPVNSQLSIKRRERTEISCRAMGSPPLQFRWFKNEQPLRGGQNDRGLFGEHFSIHEDESNRRERVTVLMINSVTRNDSAVFTCQASNHYGTDRANIRLLVQEPPDSPSDLRFLEVSSRSVTLSWSISFNGNSPITGYEIVHRASHGQSFSLMPVTPRLCLL